MFRESETKDVTYEKTTQNKKKTTKNSDYSRKSQSLTHNLVEYSHLNRYESREKIRTKGY